MGSCLGTEEPPISVDVECTCCVQVKDQADDVVIDGEIDPALAGPHGPKL